MRYPSVRLPPLLSTAHEVWNECVRRYQDDVTLITLGPLTNVAVALKVNPLTVQKFRSVIVMGARSASPATCHRWLSSICMSIRMPPIGCFTRPFH